MDSKQGKEMTSVGVCIAGTLVRILIAVSVVLHLHPSTVVYEPKLLLLILNLVFLTAVSAVVAVIAARSYMADAPPVVLSLGCGMLIYGVGCLIAGITASRGLLAVAVTTHNAGALIASLCHLVGAVGVVFRLLPERSESPRRSRVALAYLAAVLVPVAIAMLDSIGLIPAFLEAGRSTALRHGVLAAAVVSFGASAALFRFMQMKTGNVFLLWYSMALGLVGAGVFGISLSSVPGSAEIWVGRIGQYAGGVYMLIAVMLLARESKAKGVEFEEEIATSFRAIQSEFGPFLETSNDALTVFNQKGRVLFWSKASERMFGHKSSEAVGEEFVTLVANGSRAAKLRVSLEGLPRASEGIVSGSTIEAELNFRSGCGFDAELTFVGRKAGRNFATMCIVKDISVRKTMERALRESEEKFRVLAESTHDLAYQISADGVVQYISPCVIQYGFTREDIVSKPFQSFILPEDRESVAASFKHAIETGEPQWDEFRVKDAEGRVRWFDDRCTVHRDAGGQVVGLIGVLREVTERRTAEDNLRKAYDDLERRVQARTTDLARANEALQKDVAERRKIERELKELNETLERRVIARTAQLRALAAELTYTEQRERRRLAQLLHDNPQQLVTGAKMQLEVVARRLKEDKVKDDLNRIVELLDQSVRALRSLNVELSPPILHEGGLAAALKWLARWMQEKHGVAVDVNADEMYNPEADDVRVLLFQAVRELLFNVVKHAKVKSASVWLHGNGKEQVCIQVVDEGVGFAPKEPNPNDTSMGGFGLFSIKERLKLLGGNMDIRSEPGKGTRVSLAAPLKRSTSARIGEVVAGAVVEKPAGQASVKDAGVATGKVRVLLVDDHHIMRKGLANLLDEEKDIEVIAEAADGKSAIDLARRLRPDVVIMDVSMPGLSGVEATRWITAELPQVRVIGLSMHEKADMAVAMRKAGAAAYLTKGGPSEALLAAIRA